jgi:hypothetical protein
MIRFPCPLCHLPLKAPQEKAGGSIVCPRCNELSVVPSGDPASPKVAGDEAAVAIGRSSGLAAAGRADKAGILFSGMSSRLRSVVVGVAGVGVLSLLLAVFAPALYFSEEATAIARQEAAIVVPSCLVILFVLLHGHGTGCPACGKWWARTEGGTECLGREEFEKKGVHRVRSRRRTTYECKLCRHVWAVTFTEEYKGSVRTQPKRRPGF